MLCSSIQCVDVCNTVQHTFLIKLSSKEFSIYKFSSEQSKNLHIDFSKHPFFVSISRTSKELSIIAEKSFQPNIEIENIESDWGAIYIEGPIPFESVGVLDAIIHPLSAKKISVLVISTFSSDFLFFKKEYTDLVCSTLRALGFTIIAEIE